MNIGKLTAAGLAAVIGVSGLLTGCGVQSDEDLIAETIYGFTDAMNDADLDGAMSYFDKKTRAASGLILGFANGILSGATGIDDVNVSDITELMYLFVDDEEKPTIEVEPIEYNFISDKKAEVECEFEIKDSGSKKTEKEVDTVNMVYQDDYWYIDGTGLFDEFMK